MRPGAEGPVRSDAPGKFEVTVLPPTKKAPSSSSVKGPPRVAERAGAKAAASIAIPMVKRENVFIFDSFGRSRECRGSRPDPLARHLRERGDPQERHVALDFLREEPDPVAHAGLPADRGGVEERPADEHELRAAGGAGDERDARAHVLEVRHAVHEERSEEHSEKPARAERGLPR